MSDDSAGNGAAGGAQPSRAEGDEIIRLNEVFNIRGPSWRLREHDGLQIAATH